MANFRQVNDMAVLFRFVADNPLILLAAQIHAHQQTVLNARMFDRNRLLFRVIQQRRGLIERAQGVVIHHAVALQEAQLIQ